MKTVVKDKKGRQLGSEIQMRVISFIFDELLVEQDMYFEDTTLHAGGKRGKGSSSLRNKEPLYTV